MRLRRFLLVTLLAIPWACRAQAVDDEAVLNVLNWADYIGETTIEDFEREYGIEVNYDVYDSTEVVEARLLAGNTGYDVVLHSTRYSARLIPIGIYHPLEKERLTGIENLDGWVMENMRRYDPGNRYSIPYMWGTTGIAYNVDMVQQRLPNAPLDSAAMLFDPEVVKHFADCGVTLLDEPVDVIPMVLLYLGLDPNAMDLESIKAAEAQLKKVRPYIRYFSSARMINDMPNREVCVAMSWSGDYQTAMQRAREAGREIRLAYTTPREGSLLFFDGLFIPADAPHVDNAHLFLDFLLRPRVIAGVSNTTHYANANVAARQFMDPELTADPAVYPAPETRGRFDVGYVFEPKLERQRTRAWARVKSGL